MKSSQYSFCFENEQGQGYLFSTLYKSLLKLDKAGLEQWKNENYAFISNGYRDRKFVNNFLVSEKVNEFSRALHYLLEPPGLPRTIYATIVVTMDCNMNCSYCHESGRLSNVRMGASIAQKTGEFIRTLAQRHYYKRVVLYFYGGEPLLNIDAIKKICEIIDEARLSLVVYIPTNGLELSEALVLDLKRFCRNLEFQVTVDGPEKIHNSRRKARDVKIYPQGSTYQNILEKVTRISRMANITIRTNVDRENQDFVEELLDDLIARKVLPQKARWYGTPVAKVIDGGECANRFVMTQKEWLLNVEKIWSAQVKRGIILDGVEPGDGLCGISRKGLFTVDPTGGLHRCTGLHSRNEADKHISDGQIPWSTARPSEYRNACRVCAFFPYCGGGCIAQKVNYNDDTIGCSGYFTELMPTFLRYKYWL